MSTAKHTPGPWHHRGNMIVGDETDSTGYVKGVVVAVIKPEWMYPDEVKRANARLIKAAPDLLAALIELRDNVRDDSPAMWGRVDAAIAKAGA